MYTQVGGWAKLGLLNPALRSKSAPGSLLAGKFDVFVSLSDEELKEELRYQVYLITFVVLCFYELKVTETLVPSFHPQSPNLWQWVNKMVLASRG